MTEHKGTHGTITNVSSGQKITGQRNGKYGSGASGAFFFRIDNTSENNIFKDVDWTYKPDKPSAQEQFDALPIGAAFYEDAVYEGAPNFWLKVSATQVVLTDGRYNTPVVKRFNEYTSWTEIIRKEIA